MISDLEWETLTEVGKALIKAEVKLACNKTFTEVQLQLDQVIREFAISKREFLKIIMEYAIERI